MAMPTQARVMEYFNYDPSIEHKECSVEDCGDVPIKRGFCNKHYQRVRKYGDPSFIKMKTLHGVAAAFMNDVVLQYEGEECITWPFSRCPAGYARYGKILATRFVCDAQNGPAPSNKHEAAHSCGNGSKGCVTKGHLSWKTRTENERDKRIHGTDNRGERHWNTNLCNDQVKEIKKLLETTKVADIAVLYGVTKAVIYNIHHGISWVNITEVAS